MRTPTAVGTEVDRLAPAGLGPPASAIRSEAGLLVWANPAASDSGLDENVPWPLIALMMAVYLAVLALPGLFLWLSAFRRPRRRDPPRRYGYAFIVLPSPMTGITLFVVMRHQVHYLHGAITYGIAVSLGVVSS